MTPTIIPELEEKLRSLSDQEYNDLLSDIQENGQNTTITLGKIGEVEPFILDGHNRYHICNKLGLAPVYNTTIKPLEDLVEAKIWMLSHQLKGKGRIDPPFVRTQAASEIESLVEGGEGEPIYEKWSDLT